MRISEMSTERAFACMARMVPYAAGGLCAQPVSRERGGESRLPREAVTARAAALLGIEPGSAGGHSPVLGIVAALSGKTLDEVRAQPLGETMAVIRTDFDGELFRFISLCRALGAQRVTWLLHRYRPFTVDALLELARHDAAERRVALYAADMAWLNARLNARGSRSASGRFEIQPPSEIAREAFSAETRVRDTRSGAQIVADLAARLRQTGPAASSEEEKR